MRVACLFPKFNALSLEARVDTKERDVQHGAEPGLLLCRAASAV